MPASKRIGLAVGLSFAAHATAYYAWTPPSPPSEAGGNTILAIQMQPLRPSAETADAPPRPEPTETTEAQRPAEIRAREEPSGRRVEVVPKAAPRPAESVTKMAASPPPSPTPPPASRPPSRSARAQPPMTHTATPASALGPDKVIHRIERHLAEAFVYPLQARRRGWQGTVILAVEITPEGEVGEVLVVDSSGYGLLDRSAQRTLSGLGTLFAPDEVRRFSVRRFTLPVTYRLTG